MTTLTEAFGFARSWLIYRGPTWRRRDMTTLYRRYVRPGELCFDIGAHVGNRVSVFRDLGARVVAVEPQALFARYLRSRIADDEVEVVEAAVGASPGQAELHTDPANPTVSTLSEEFRARANEDPSWASVRWRRTDPVRVTTLDALIERFGSPSFCKIDVEGAELDVLRGLSQPLSALSFEVVPAMTDRALEVIDRLCASGDYRFNFSPSESMTLSFEQDRDRAAIEQLLTGLRVGDPSGDVYACLA